MGYSPWGRKESDTTEGLFTSLSQCIYVNPNLPFITPPSCIHMLVLSIYVSLSALQIRSSIPFF